MAGPFQVFVAVYAVALMVASVVVFTSRGQAVILRVMEWVGTHSNLGPWSFISHKGDNPHMDAVPVALRAQLAEAYIAEAEERTLGAARVVLWVLIGGCVASAFAAVVIVTVLPPLVVSGAWDYEQYRMVSLGVVYLTAAGGLGMGIGLLVWLVRKIFTVSCTDRCAAVRSLVAQVRRSGVNAEVAHELSMGRYPRLRRLLHELR